MMVGIKTLTYFAMVEIDKGEEMGCGQLHAIRFWYSAQAILRPRPDPELLDISYKSRILASTSALASYMYTTTDCYAFCPFDRLSSEEAGPLLAVLLKLQ